MQTVTLPSGEVVPALGQGTWGMGERPAARRAEADALRLGIDLGLTLLDTAEMYGDGGAEEVVADAVQGRRDAVFIVSKVYPHNATRRGTAEACARSLKRLGTDRIDLYLLHWPGRTPVAETIEAFLALQQAGDIRYFGVSNFDVEGLEAWFEATGGDGCATNQVIYNPTRRGIEFDLLPWCAVRGLTTMAYSPLEQARMLNHPALTAVAARHGATAAQIGVAWALRQPGMMVIPKAVRPEHVRANAAARDLSLTATDLAEIDAAFPPPTRRRPLEML